jgi:hypothetical protein
MFTKFPLRALSLILLSLLVLTGSLAAQDADPTMVYVIEESALTECPEDDCATVATLPANAALTVLETISDDGDPDAEVWLRVNVPDSTTEGYINATLVSAYAPDSWRSLPVVPQVDVSMREVYQRGLEQGNNPHAFSVVGDCQNVSAYFLADFENPLQYDLGEHEDLQDTIDYFAGSFGRERAAVRGGYNVASVLSPMWADPELCEKGESPLSCEYRLQQPSFALISMETWWDGQPIAGYEAYLRQVVDYWLEQGVVPILATKADDVEGGHRINAAVARIARDYKVPLWNFWLAVQDLPNGGLTDDAFHLTYGRPFFADPAAMHTGWAVRNLTALQVLDMVRRSVMAEDVG